LKKRGFGIEKLKKIRKIETDLELCAFESVFGGYGNIRKK